jgi:hypothetical protein
MGPVLGCSDSRNQFNVHDDRIVDLQLHLNVDDSLGNDVIVGMWWAPHVQCKTIDSGIPPRVVLAPNPVIERYKRDVDHTLLRENLKLSVEQRLLQHRKMAEMVAELRKGSRK